MLLYVIYNADLLEITDDKTTEDVLGYMDNIALLATGNDFKETAIRLKQLMTKEDGGLQWSKEHNSRFEVTKSFTSQGRPAWTQTRNEAECLWKGQN